jgi:hypothetical protein
MKPKPPDSRTLALESEFSVGANSTTTNTETDPEEFPMRSMLFVLLLMTFATPALATNGTLEINQTCAVQTGCFAGDTAGYPVTIAAAGSYILTSDLTGIGANINGIVLNNSRITIDFNGFTLAGPAIGTGTGHGVSGGGTDGSFAGLATLKNGVIRGARARGISLIAAKGVRVTNMTIDSNAEGGIWIGDDAHVTGNRFVNNGATNSDIGMTTGARSLISQNVVSGSGGSGISTGEACTISQNSVSTNGSNGIIAGDGSTISGNSAYQNSNRGIEAGSGSIVSRNAVRLNSGYGLFMGSDAGYWGNVVSGNMFGTVFNGQNLGSNYCAGNAVGLPACP